MDKIKNIIFDLGGVIIDIHFDKTIDAFASLNPVKEEWIRAQALKNEIFLKHETGKMDDETFIHHLKGYLEVEVSSWGLIRAWNAMLGLIPEQRIEAVLQLKKDYKTFLISNTNQIHIDDINLTLEKQYPKVKNLENLFEKVYYSHKVGKRKPNFDIFEQVVQENGLKIEETLFLDDTLDNIEAAKKFGFPTFHILRNSDQVLEVVNLNL